VLCAKRTRIAGSTNNGWYTFAELTPTYDIEESMRVTTRHKNTFTGVPARPMTQFGHDRRGDDGMHITDLSEKDEGLYFVCLEDWSDEMKEAMDHKERWYGRMKEKGLRVKLAADDNGVVGGMIQYIPIELSHAHGEGLYFINCIWVHGYKEGRGDFRKRGMGKALLKAAEDDARDLGAKGMAAWGVGLPVWMRASWFKKQGYEKVDKNSMAVLLWKPFNQDAKPPYWVKQKKKPQPTPGKVSVTSFMNGWCPAQNLIYERAKRAAAEMGDKVVFNGIDTSDKSTFLEWGISDGLFIDDKAVRTGPPPSYEKLRKLIAKRVRRLK
jgi:GNAT superfamily N-acetyltransferase